jgi:putative membrane protein
MMYNGYGMGGWGMILMTVSSVLFWAAVIAGVVAVVRYIGRDAQRNQPVMHGPTPQQMLAARFARGDIDEEQYTRDLRVLSVTAPPYGHGD